MLLINNINGPLINDIVSFEQTCLNFYILFNVFAANSGNFPDQFGGRQANFGSGSRNRMEACYI